jgi:hypothetical protein
MGVGVGVGLGLGVNVGLGVEFISLKVSFGVPFLY